MWRWLIVLMLLLVTAPTPLAAQDITVERGVRGDDADKGNEEQTTGNDALPYVVAVLCTAMVMVVVLMPARKV